MEPSTEQCNSSMYCEIFRYEEKEADDTCEYNENTGYVVYSALGSFFLPLLVMLYVYARIACVITRRQRSIQKLQARGDRVSI